MRSHKKFGPDGFSRFDVYWIQTNKQTDRHQDKPNLYIDLVPLQTSDTQTSDVTKVRQYKCQAYKHRTGTNEGLR